MHTPLNRKTAIFLTSKPFIVFIAIAGMALIAGFSSISFIQNKTNPASFASPQEPSDINNDNKVDIADLSILISSWNTNNSLSDINIDGTVNIFDLSKLISRWGVVKASGGVYGTGYNMDALGNLQVGGTSSGSPNTYASIRFRAEQTNTIPSIRVYWIGIRPDGSIIPGYAGGNGGAIRVTLQADNNGVPSGIPLATLDHYPGVLRQNFPLLTFSSPSAVTAGTLYHIVFTNFDPNPTVNFVSVEGTWISGNVLVPRQPSLADADYAILAKYGSGSWVIRGDHTPIVDITYGNGLHQGQGYIEVEIENQPLITGTTRFMRERFTVSGGDRVIRSGAVRVAKTGGSGDLIVKLENASGALIDSFSVPASAVPTLPANNIASGVWVTGSFSAPRTLTNGETYYLRLSTDSATTYWSRGIEQAGTAYGFDSSTYFNDGYLQYTLDGGTTWSTVSGLSNNGDLQFYLY